MTYDEAVQEWVARRLRERGHVYGREDVRNVRFGLGEGWGGSDVTPPEGDFCAFVCELRVRGRDGWASHQENIEHVRPAELIAECLAIYGADPASLPSPMGRRVI